MVVHFTFMVVMTALLVSKQPVYTRAEKLTVCVVDGRGGYKRSGRYCPTLDQIDSHVECVLGVDRMDCIRKLSKGMVDFTVMNAEDLIVARNSQVEMLLTNELRYINRQFDYEVVAVIRNDAGIKSRHDVRDKRFCHPGYGYENDWTDILANYLEISVAIQICNPTLSLTENRIKATSDFFKKACKPGPWISKPAYDDELKKRYPNLCSACNDPNTCSTSDKYWGRRGSLYCLTDDAGDISWARFDDVQAHFGLAPGSAEATADDFSYLCPDDTIRPLNSSTPCVWVVKPWPVIGAKSSSAAEVQRIISTLLPPREAWQNALLNLLETYHVTFEQISPPIPIENYLDRATGFLNANSFSGCHPPRTVRICTTSILETAKCSWLREVAAVYGVEPDLECLKADNVTHCMQAISQNIADIVITDIGRLEEMTTHQLQPLFYETSNDTFKYLTVAVTLVNNNKIKKIEDLKGQRVCFPEYKGVAWNSVGSVLSHLKLLEQCPVTNKAIEEFFGDICAPGIGKGHCTTPGDMQAIKCLLGGKGQVAFLSRNSLNTFVHNPNLNTRNVEISNFYVLCDQRLSGGCHFSWAPLGVAAVRANSSDHWMKDTFDLFMRLDLLFGKNYKSHNIPLQMYGLFDGQPNVLFQDNTQRLRAVPTIKNTDTMPRLYPLQVTCGKSSTANTRLQHPELVLFLVMCIVAFLR